MKNSKKKRCVFLDRDGVINVDKGYISKVSDFKIYPGVGKAIKFLNKKNYLVIIITNQDNTIIHNRIRHNKLIVLVIDRILTRLIHENSDQNVAIYTI